MENHKGWIRYTKLEDEDVKIGSMSLANEGLRKEASHTADEQTKEMLKGFPDQVIECFNNTKKHFSNCDFFIEVLFKSDRTIMDHETRLFIGRGSCPDAFYDQTVYRYCYKDDKVEHLWTIPDIETATIYINNFELVPFDEYDVYQHLKDMYAGTLAKKTYDFNNKNKKKIVITT